MEMQQNETRVGGGESKISRCASQQVSVGSVVFLLFRAVVGVRLDLGLIINPQAAQTSIAVHTHTKECSAAVRGGTERKEIREGGEGALNSVMNG